MMKHVQQLSRILPILITSYAVHAAEWVSLPNPGSGDQYFYDSSKLTIKDEEITYWKKVMFVHPQNINGKEAISGILRERLHCGEHTATLLSYLYYSATGETVQYVANNDATAIPVIPDTVGDAFERILCPLVWQKQEESRIKTEQKSVEEELKSSSAKKNDAKKEEKKSVTISPPTPPKTPNVHIPQKPATTLPMPQLPMPQIMEQLY